MAVSAKVVTGTLPNTISGTVDLTSSGFGTAGAAIIFLSNAGSTNPANTFFYNIGFWDGSNDKAVGISCKNSVTVSDTARAYKDADIVAFPNLGGSGYQVRASASAVTDGIRLTITEDNYGNDATIGCILLKGLTNAVVGTHTFDNGTSAQDITAPGFKPDLVFFMGVGGTTGIHNDAILSFGAAHNNSSDVVTQACSSFASEDGQSAIDCECRVDDDKCAVRHLNGVETYTVSASAFDSSGFSLTTSVGTVNTITYLALELPDPDDANIQVIDSATGTGTTATTGTGFTPDLLVLAQSMATAVDTITDEGYFGLGASDGTTEFNAAGADEESATTSNTQSSHNTTNILDLDFDDGTADALADVDSFDADGFTLNYSDASASARKMVAITIGNSAPAATGGLRNPLHGPIGLRSPLGRSAR